MKSWAGRRLSLIVLVVGVGVAVGGIAYAAIPDSGGLIHGCYNKNSGNLRVIDTSGKGCTTSEKALNWNQTGLTGATGPSGSAGPTSLEVGDLGSVTDTPQEVLSHTVTAQEAGLTLMTASVILADKDGTTGGSTAVNCFLKVNADVGVTYEQAVSDNGSAAYGNTDGQTLLDRQTLAAGDLVHVQCSTAFTTNSSGEGKVHARLLLQRVAS
jgi:hypothetical protein